MKLPTYQFLAQMSAAIAVVVSLGFVAYELKQARDISLVEVVQNRLQIELNIDEFAISDEKSYAAFRKQKLEGDESLSEEEAALLSSSAETRLLLAETTFLAYERGLLDDETWASEVGAIRHLFRTICMRNYWDSPYVRAQWRETFVDVVDEILEGEPRGEYCPIEYL